MIRMMIMMMMMVIPVCLLGELGKSATIFHRTKMYDNEAKLMLD